MDTEEALRLSLAFSKIDQAAQLLGAGFDELLENLEVNTPAREELQTQMKILAATVASFMLAEGVVLQEILKELKTQKEQQ